jgi:hypothetical protein
MVVLFRSDRSFCSEEAQPDPTGGAHAWQGGWGLKRLDGTLIAIAKPFWMAVTSVASGEGFGRSLADAFRGSSILLLKTTFASNIHGPNHLFAEHIHHPAGYNDPGAIGNDPKPEQATPRVVADILEAGKILIQP